MAIWMPFGFLSTKKITADAVENALLAAVKGGYGHIIQFILSTKIKFSMFILEKGV